MPAAADIMRALRIVGFAIGMIVGVCLWVGVGEAYNHVLAAAAEPLVKIDGRFRDAELVADGRAIRVAPRDTTQLPPATMPADELTYSVIILFALFGASERPWRGRNLGALAISLIPVSLSHVVTLAISIESTYANRLGAWSEAHYGGAAMNIWLMAELFMRVVGMFAVAFACWWAGRPATSPAR
jgi:hypothetical protein